MLLPRDYLWAGWSYLHFSNFTALKLLANVIKKHLVLNVTSARYNHWTEHKEQIILSNICIDNCLPLLSTLITWYHFFKTVPDYKSQESITRKSAASALNASNFNIYALLFIKTELHKTKIQSKKKRMSIKLLGRRFNLLYLTNVSLLVMIYRKKRQLQAECTYF